MTTRERRGDFIPGFSCATGQAVNHTHGEWEELTKNLTSVRRNGYTQVFDGDVLVYEIYDEHQ
jgi:hypothetical protein